MEVVSTVRRRFRRAVWPVECWRLFGETVAAVAAESIDAAAEAAAPIVVDYEERPAVLSVQAALDSSSPLNSSRKGVSGEHFGVLARKCVDVAVTSRSMNGFSAGDLRTDLQPRTCCDWCSRPRNDPLSVEFV